jgi:xanthine dehydrogenase accessory factor
VIASHKRARLVLEFLRGQGLAEEDLARVSAPAGLDLGARTPEEIALSVLGEIVMLRRGGSGRPMRNGIGGHHTTPQPGQAEALAELRS